MSTKLLSSLVQTKSIELVLAPIAAQVSQLIILNEAGERDGIPMPYLMSSANQISASVQSLVLAGQKLVSESADDEFKTAMPLACAKVAQAGKELQTATHQLNKEPFSHAVRYSLVDSARNILEGTMKVLLVYDQAEVRKIVRAAHWVMDRLGLAEAVTSLKGFVVSFKGFTESLMLLASLCDKRQRELSNPRQRDRLLSAMAILKKSIGLLSSTMQTYLRHPANPQAKASRDYVVGQIKLACTEIIKTVEARGDEQSNFDEPGQLAATMQKAHRQLRPTSRLDATTQLDCYLDAIVRSSMAVANTCEGARRDRIVLACQNVLQTRNELAELQKTVMANPNSLRARREFDMTVERLSGELKRLDRQVTLAIVDQISDVFADAELPIHQLMSSATLPLLDRSALSQEQVLLKLKQKADLFQRHAGRLVEVSKHAASISGDARRVHIINSTSTELEKITPQLVTAAAAVRRAPHDRGAVDRLGFLRHDWGNRLLILTDAVDDITDARDFMDISEAHIQGDIAFCHEALTEKNAAKLAQASRGLLSRGHRVVQVAKREMMNTADPMFKGTLQSTSGELEAALPSLGLAVEEAICNIGDSSLHENVNDNIRQIMGKVKTIKMAVQRPTGSAMEFIDSSPTPSEALDHDPAMPTVGPDLLEGLYAASDTSSTEGGSEVVLPFTEELVSSSPISSDLAVTKKSPAEIQPQTAPSPRFLKKIEKKHLSRSVENLLFAPEEEEMEVADQQALLGLSAADSTSQPLTSLSSILGRPVKPSRSSRVPVTRLLRAAKDGDRDKIERHIKDLVSKAEGLKQLAEISAEKSHNVEQVRQVRVTSGEIEKLTSMIVQAARDVTANPRDMVTVDRLHTIGREWASKIHMLSNAVDEMVMPWSAPASKLSLAATSGDADELRKQVDNINSHVVRLRQLASSAKAAADAEDYAVDAGNESDVPARDPASLQRIELVRVTSGEIEKMTPQLISAAQFLVSSPTEVARVERLELLRREWACKVHNLVFAVDDVTVGTSAPVEQLAAAAMESDHHTLQERMRLVTSYTRTLKEMAGASTAGCRDQKKVARVESTVASVERLTADLHDTTRIVADLSARENKTMEQNLAFMSIVEKMSLTRREWAAKVHLLTALVDDLTAEVSAPVDRLAGAALAVSRADLSEKLQQEQVFEAQAQELSSRVVRVRNHASKAVERSKNNSKVRTVRVTGDFIDRLTPQVIGAARALADNPDQPTVEHFQMLRRQWASKAQLLMATLDELSDANVAAVQNVIQDLLGALSLEAAASFESLTEDDSTAIAGSSRLFTPSPEVRGPREPMPQRFVKPRRSPSPPRKLPVVPPKPVFSEEPVLETKRTPKTAVAVDDIDVGRKKAPPMDRSLSDSEAFPDTRRRVPMGASSSETDIRKALVDELHQRFSSTDSLNRSRWDARYWAKFEIERKRHQRAVSLSDLRRPDWMSESTEDLRARKSSKSIALAAKLLQEEAEQWDEENNSIVRVAKKMAQQMLQIAQFARQRGKLQNKMEMINTTKAIAANGNVILEFAHVLAKQCVDERSRNDLLYYAEYIPTMSTQLKIISSVKAATPNDFSADAMLVRNAENLMQAVVKTLKAAEAACVKGLAHNQDGMTADHAEAADLAFQWKNKLKRQRAIEALTASRDHLGLRRRELKQSTPSLADIVHV